MSHVDIYSFTDTMKSENEMSIVDLQVNYLSLLFGC